MLLKPALVCAAGAVVVAAVFALLVASSCGGGLVVGPRERAPDAAGDAGPDVE